MKPENRMPRCPDSQPETIPAPAEPCSGMGMEDEEPSSEPLGWSGWFVAFACLAALASIPLLTYCDAFVK